MKIEDPDLANTSPEELTSTLRRHLEHSLTVLTEKAKEAEEELDVEAANLESLVSKQNDALQKQLASLTGTVRSLHQSLKEARSDLREAQGAAAKLDRMFQEEEEARAEQEDNTSSENEPDTSRMPGTDKPNKETKVSPAEAGRLRHDEPITLKSVARSLFMADEPGQRERWNTEE